MDVRKNVDDEWSGRVERARCKCSGSQVAALYADDTFGATLSRKRDLFVKDKRVSVQREVF